MLLWSSVGDDDASSSGGGGGGGGGLAPAFTFTQRLGSAFFRLQGNGNGTFAGTRGGTPLFECVGSTRVVTDAEGKVTSVVGASTATQTVRLRLPGAALPVVITVAPNQEWAIRDGSPPALVRHVPFVRPFG